MPLDPLLVEVLACPVDKGPLWWFEDEELLYNPRLRRTYAVREGVPVMLVDESTEVGEAEHERLCAKHKAGGAVETGPASSVAGPAPGAPK